VLATSWPKLTAAVGQSRFRWPTSATSAAARSPSSEAPRPTRWRASTSGAEPAADPSRGARPRRPGLIQPRRGIPACGRPGPRTAGRSRGHSARRANVTVRDENGRGRDALRTAEVLGALAVGAGAFEADADLGDLCAPAQGVAGCRVEVATLGRPGRGRWSRRAPWGRERGCGVCRLPPAWDRHSGFSATSMGSGANSVIRSRWVTAGVAVRWTGRV